MIEHSIFYLLVDTLAILATVGMLYVTEKEMERRQTETIEQHIHGMLNDPGNEEDITTWSVDDIVADLLAYADLDDQETEDVIRQHVISWKANKVHPT